MLNWLMNLGFGGSAAAETINPAGLFYKIRVAAHPRVMSMAHEDRTMMVPGEDRGIRL